jgi:CBS domain containing-hemolysin-like protein
MVFFIIGLLLAVAAVICWVLLQTYRHVPSRELKRMARSGDEVAELIYRAVSYGASLRALLGVTMVVCAVLSLVSLSSAIGIWLTILLLAAVFVVGWLVLVPGDRLTHGSLWLAKRVSPGIAWVLERIHPIVDGSVHLVSKYRHIRVHTGLYEKVDLVELLEQQKGQPDSRISESEIILLQHALLFGDKMVSDALIPLRVVHMVARSDAVGPILMDELSKSGHSRFPVYTDTRDEVVGILYLHDLVSAKHSGTVADVMSRKLTYVHEDFTLYQALQAFLKTKRHLFLVVNSFEELVGILTIEDVLEQIIGTPIMDEFDKYDDLRAVAAAAAKKEHKTHQKDMTEPKVDEALPGADTTPGAKEMVE